MSHSPPVPERGTGLNDYLHHWNTLSNLIRAGHSFSGREQNCVFLNFGQERWADISGVSGLDFADDGRAIAVTDWDQDGDLDLWIANRTGPRLRFMRNRCQSNNQYVRLQLAGTGLNQDAIGARVEVVLSDRGRRLIKTLRAGGGFVSQSSKWLHFGLGTDSRIDQVTVRWPNGTLSTYGGIEPNRSYRLAPGVEPKVAAPRASVELSESSPTVEVSAERILLTRRLQLPELEYAKQSGGNGKLREHSSGPTLVTLWASWCPKCAEELRQLETHRSSYSGLRILALCADDVASGNPTSSSAREIIASKSISSDAMEWGIALPETMSTLSQIRSQVLYRQRPLELPASFLLDASGRLAALYAGPVSPRQLTSDLKIVQEEATTMAHAFPFAGKSGLRQLPFSPPEIAAAYVEGGYYQEAEEELIRYLVETRRKLNKTKIQPTKELARRIERSYLYLGTLLRAQQRTSESRAVIQQGLELLPRSSKLKRAAASF